jgi:hypothetical protein
MVNGGHFAKRKMDTRTRRELVRPNAPIYRNGERSAHYHLVVRCAYFVFLRLDPRSPSAARATSPWRKAGCSAGGALHEIAAMFDPASLRQLLHEPSRKVA